MAGSIRHLLARNGRFYPRVAVPKALRSIVGKRELLEAIGAGRSEALRALPAAAARMQATILSRLVSPWHASKIARAVQGKFDTEPLFSAIHSEAF